MTAGRDIPSFDLAGRRIGGGAPCFVIAEVGVNHNGDMETARRLIDAAVAAGADAVKFQTFDAERLAAPSAPLAEYQKRSEGAANQQEMLAALQLDADDHRTLMAYCTDKGIVFLSSPFDEQAAQLLFDLSVPAFKIPSGEITNVPFLDRIASFGLPVILSTGMADKPEIERALKHLDAVRDRTAVLHCVSSYPAPDEDMNLRAIGALGRDFDVVAGLSDHSVGTVLAVASVALGAAIVEKHITLDRSMPGPDHRASIEPDELTQMITDIRRVEAALGDEDYAPRGIESQIAQVARKSLATARDISKGEKLAPGDLTAQRPGTGIAPSELERMLGLSARRDLPRGTLVAWEDVE